ncbi:MAG: substrate-binding domain-containing protein [Bradymonadaceae bacterium]
MPDHLNNDIQRKRRELELTQQQLADRVGVTRQTLGAVESGRSAPSTAVALRLARELSCRVEDLFWIDDLTATIQVYLAADENVQLPNPAPVALGRVGTRWIAHALSPGELNTASSIADGQVRLPDDTGSGSMPAEAWASAAELAGQVLIAGCAPPLGLLEKQTAGLAHGRVRWLSRPSLRALDLLVRKEVHVAGLHVPGSDDEYNVEILRRTFAPGSMGITTLASWNIGLVVASGNPKSIRGIEDLRRKDVRFIRREDEAGAQLVLLRELDKAGIDPALLHISAAARGHLQVAQAVMYGAADVGVTVEGVALGLGLPFIPLTKERFDLVYLRELEDDELLAPALETLTTGKFRRPLEACGSYDVAQTGAQISF